MKYTNIKKLLIKFMGGGLINFPTRFLRWVKIDGDAEGDDDGGSGNNDSDPIRSFIEKMTYGVCSDYEIDEESGIITIKEPNNIPRIYKADRGFGYNYENDSDTLTSYLGSDDETKIVLNGEEIAINDLFDGNRLKYKAIIIGYYDTDFFGYEISVPIVYINAYDNSWKYIGQHSGIFVDKNNNRVTDYNSEIRDAHFHYEGGIQ